MSSMVFQNPWGSLLFTSLAVISIIYFFRRKYRVVPISGLFLWNYHIRSVEGGRTYERFNLIRAFILDIVSCILLVSAFCLPSLLSDRDSSLVIVLDQSFSMRADDNFEKAKQQASIIVSQKSDYSRIVVILAGEEPDVVCDEEGASNALEAIKKFDPYSRTSDLMSSLKMARELVTGFSEIHVFTDQNMEFKNMPETKLVVRTYKGDYDNLAFVSAFRRISDVGKDADQIYFTIANYSSHEAILKVKITVDNREEPFHTIPAKINGYGRKSFEMEISQCRGENIIINLEGEADKIAQDSEIVLVPEPERIVSYSLQYLPETEKYFRLALNATGAVDVTPSVNAVLDIGPDSAQARSFNTRVVFVNPSGEPKVTPGPFVINLHSDLCTDVSLGGCYWSFKNIGENYIGENSTVLISAGDTPLYWKTGDNVFVLNLNLEKSNLAKLPAWPTLVSNLVKHVRENISGLQKSNYCPTDFLDYNVSADTGKIFYFQADNSKMQKMYSNLVPGYPGIFELKNKDKSLGRIAVNSIYTSESDLTGLSSNSIVKEFFLDSSGEFPKALKFILVPFLLAALLFMFLNWWLDYRKHQCSLRDEKS